MQLAITHAMLEAAVAVDIVHEIVGASGVRDEFGFSRYFRDIHVITQHGFINAAKLQPVGADHAGARVGLAVLRLLIPVRETDPAFHIASHSLAQSCSLKSNRYRKTGTPVVVAQQPIEFFGATGGSLLTLAIPSHYQ